MTRLKKAILFILVLALLSGVYWGYTQQTAVEPKPIEENAALKEVIDQCSDITERAAAHLVAIVEFQKLEIIGRKARVFKMCLQDHGYIENKDWLIYSEAIAKVIATKNGVSVNEALENLRRADMVVPRGDNDRPTYWMKEKKPSSAV